MLPHISTVYQKMAEIIMMKNDMAYCLHMNTIQSIVSVIVHIVRIGRVTSASEQLPKIPPISTPELSMTMCQIL